MVLFLMLSHGAFRSEALAPRSGLKDEERKARMLFLVAMDELGNLRRQMISKDLTEAQQWQVLAWLEDLNRPKALDRIPFLEARSHLAFFTDHGDDAVKEKARQLLAKFESKLNAWLGLTAEDEFLDLQKISIDWTGWRPADNRRWHRTIKEYEKEVLRPIIQDSNGLRRTVYLQTGIVLDHVHDVQIGFLRAGGNKEAYRITVNGKHSFALLVGQLYADEVLGIMAQGYMPGRNGLLRQFFETNLFTAYTHFKAPYMFASLVDGQRSLMALGLLKVGNNPRYEGLGAGFVRNVMRKLLTYCLRSGYAPRLDSNFKDLVIESLEKPETVQLYEPGHSYSADRFMRFETLSKAMTMLSHDLSPAKDHWFIQAVADGIVDALWDAGLEISEIERMGRELTPPEAQSAIEISLKRIHAKDSDFEQAAKDQLFQRRGSGMLIQAGDTRLRLLRQISDVKSDVYEAVYASHGRQRHGSMRFYAYPRRIPPYDLIRRRLAPFKQFQLPFQTFRCRADLTAVVSDWVEGTDLRQWILEGISSDPGWWRMLATIVDDVLVSLQIMHSHGIFHLEPLPKNVIVRPDHTIALVDWESVVVDPIEPSDHARVDYARFLQSLGDALPAIPSVRRAWLDGNDMSVWDLRDSVMDQVILLSTASSTAAVDKIRAEVGQAFDRFIEQLENIMPRPSADPADVTASSL